jgi:hypothetical protein
LTKAFLAHFAKGNVSFAITWRPSSVNFSHFNLLNQKQELPVVAMFVNGSGRNEQF